MVKTNSRTPAPTYSNYSNQRKKYKNVPFKQYTPSSNNLFVQGQNIPHQLSNINKHSHHTSPHVHTSAATRPNTGVRNSIPPSVSSPKNMVINPFNNPPPNCTESDIRWIWRTQLEQKRRHIRNTKYYSNYIGNKKQSCSDKQPFASNYSKSYGNTHHLKHLVKLGCAKHDLAPLLTQCGYNVSPSICSHKSYTCPTANTTKRVLLGNVSIRDVGLTFKRNAFSTMPLHIRYLSYSNHKNADTFETDVYIKRIANTNFNKAFRPGSYGKLHSLKKGSWKEGKIFYVFEDNELVMNVSNNVQIVFDMKAKKSNDIIDGFENVVGGVGLYRPPQSTKIVSCLVFRKDPNFPMECLENSSIKVYGIDSTTAINAKLMIGDKTFDLSNVGTNGYYDDASTRNSYENYNNSNGASIHSNDTDFCEQPMWSLNTNSNSSNVTNSSNCDNVCCDYGYNEHTSMPLSVGVPTLGNNASYSSNSCCSLDANGNGNGNEVMHNMNTRNRMDIEALKTQFENKFSALQYQNNLLVAKNYKLQTLNKQLMESNSHLAVDKERQYSAHSTQMDQLQLYLQQQQQRIAKLNAQVKQNMSSNISVHSVAPLIRSVSSLNNMSNTGMDGAMSQNINLSSPMSNAVNMSMMNGMNNMSSPMSNINGCNRMFFPISDANVYGNDTYTSQNF